MNQGRQVVIVGNSSSRRVELFQQSLINLSLPPARIVPYLDFINGSIALPDVIASGALVRIESPGKDFDVELALLAEGESAAERDGCAFFSKNELEQLQFDKGRILAPRQWYLGYSIILEKIKEQLAGAQKHQLMNHPDDIVVMFDKRRCHQIFHEQSIPVPRGLGVVGSFQELKLRMREKRFSQVFVKLSHGSSASGVVAYRTNGSAHKAFSTVEMVESRGRIRLYNNRKIRTYENEIEISRLIDQLCHHNVHVEEWFPKATMSGKKVDLRVVTISGKAMHVMVRESDSPFTNLHLLNKRSNPDLLRNKIGTERWQSLLDCCERAMLPFHKSLYAGIDLMIGSNFRSHAIAEINAFGDHLEGALCRGRDTYTAELESLSLGSATVFVSRPLDP